MSTPSKQLTVEEPPPSVSPIFLGICRGALLHGDGVSQDLFRISPVVIAPFFPQTLSGVYLVLGISRKLVGKNLKLTLIDARNPANQAWANIQILTREGPSRARVTGARRQFSGLSSDEGATVCGPSILMHPAMDHVLMPLPCPPLVLFEPTHVEICATIDATRATIGGFRCEFVQPPPISAEELQAIKSRPGAAAAIVMSISCKNCQDHIKLESSLVSAGEVTAVAGAVRLEDAPDRWNCRCGKITAPLKYLRLGLHDVFRRSVLKGENLFAEFSPLYEKGAIAAVVNEYTELLESDPLEEPVQKFLEDNPILWDFLSPTWIKTKPPVLTKKEADFAILTESKILYLVEIEKPRTKLAKRDGGIHSELQAGLNQIRDWRVIIQDHRAAFIDSLGLASDEVDDIRFVLVAGLARKTLPAHMATLRRNPLAHATFYCFDELASFLHATESAMRRLH